LKETITLKTIGANQKHRLPTRNISFESELSREKLLRHSSIEGIKHFTFKEQKNRRIDFCNSTDGFL
jgi:hypothetical protein